MPLRSSGWALLAQHTLHTSSESGSLVEFKMLKMVSVWFTSRWSWSCHPMVFLVLIFWLSAPVDQSTSVESEQLWFKQARCDARNILLNKHSHLKVHLVAALDFLQQMEFAQLSWNCTCSNFKGLLVGVGLKVELWGSLLAAVDKIISPQGPFTSCSEDFDHNLLKKLSLHTWSTKELGNFCADICSA